MLWGQEWSQDDEVKSQHRTVDAAISEALLEPAERTVAPLLWEAAGPQDG